MFHRLIALAFLFAFGFTFSSSAAVIDPTHVFEIQFSVSNTSAADDTLWLGFVGGSVNVLSPYTGADITIYDGQTPLGSLVAPSNPLCAPTGACSWAFLASFQTASSTAGSSPFVVIPFGTIQNGTINGRIDITVQSGAVDTGNAPPYFFLGVSGPNGGLTVTSETVNVLSTQLVSTAPEPCSIAMAGLGALVFVRRQARKAARRA